MKIPKKFKLFGTTINIVWNNKRLHDMEAYGLEDYSRCEITLSNKNQNGKVSKDRIVDTFYHERTHAILNAMNETDLSRDENFVDVFSKLLRQADETAKY